MREEFHVPPKGEFVEGIRSPGPFDPGGYTIFQLNMGKSEAEKAGRPYDAFGATPYNEDDVDDGAAEN